MRALFDTNILIDYLNGVKAAEKELARYATPIVSIITFMEVLIGCENEEEEKAVRKFLNGFEIIHLDQEIAESTVLLRRKHKMRLPDAVVWASAISLGCLLISRNSKDFPSEDPSVRVPYRL